MEHESFESEEVAARAQRRLRLDQGRPRGAARRRPRLHDVRAVDDRVRRLADDGVPHARAEAVLRRHLLSAAVEVGTAGLHRSARRDRARVDARSRARRLRRGGAVRSAEVGRRRRRPVAGRIDASPAPTRSPRRWSSSRRRSTAATAASATSPKFPRPSELLFLLREHARTGAQPPLLMATETLRAMALGGMRDHVGGGFHRYSVDAEWRVPHFEKMLYDQAQLVLAYLEAGAGAPATTFFAAVAEDTLAYVARDMRDAGRRLLFGGGRRQRPRRTAGAEEGRRLLRLERRRDRRAPRRRRRHRPQALRHRAGRQRAAAIRRGSSPARTCSTRRAVDRGDRRRHRPDAGGGRRRRSARARQVLFEARAQRPRPHLDDKVLTSWNGMMIAAFARAARVLPGRPQARGVARDGARRGARSSATQLWRAADGTLLRRYRDGDASIDGYAEDYASLIWGLLELFQADGDPAWLAWARELQAQQDARFWDEQDGGWFSTTGHDPSVLLRLKEDYDGAEPSASSVSVLNLLTLAHLTGRRGRARRRRSARSARYGERAGRAGARDPDDARRHSRRGTPARRRSSSSAPTSDATPLRRGNRAPLPAVRAAGPGDARRSRSRRSRPRCRSSRPCSTTDGRATAFVCRDFACREPVTTADGAGRAAAAGMNAPVHVALQRASRRAPRSASSTRRGTSSPRR